MGREKKYEIDMCTGKIFPKLIQFAVPLMLSSLLQLLFNAADIVVVGRFGSEHSLAAVGSTTALINIMINLCVGVSVGSTVLASQYIGSMKKKELSKVVHTSIALSLIMGTIFTIISVSFARQILILMQTPLEVVELSAKYVRIYFCGLIGLSIYNFGTAILRAKGDTQRPLYILMLTGGVNVILNLVFVIGLKMDVAGVALATLTSQYLSAIIVILLLVREKGDIKLDLRKIRIDKKILGKILYIGIPSSFQGVVFNLSNIVIQASVNSFGAVVMAGSAAAANIEGFIWVCMNAFSQAGLAFMSQNLGAGKYSRLDKVNITTVVSAVVTGLVLGTVAVYFGPQLIGIYTSQPEKVPAGMVRLKMIGTTYFLCGIMDCLAGNIRGLGYSGTPTLVSLIGACGLRLLWIVTIFRIPQFHSVYWLFITYPITWTITFIAHAICYVILRRKYPRVDGELYESYQA